MKKLIIKPYEAPQCTVAEIVFESGLLTNSQIYKSVSTETFGTSDDSENWN